ncbi:MAG: hypothetical protein K2M12_04880 [Muribaculaceae bacterium]|nr:hypothetical protein [Muribaculaceae bacterium]
MKKLFLIAAAAVLSLSAVAAPANAWRPGSATENAFRFAPKAKAEQTQSAEAAAALARVKAIHKADAVQVDTYQLPASSQTGYLDSPDGQTWFYTVEYESTKIQHEYYTEEVVSGYTITVYDAAFKKIGEVKDEIEMREGETRVAQVQVGAQVTTKFFNFDSNYELMVFVSFNTAQYVNVNRTYVYSLSSSDVTTETCAVMDGYYVDAVNSATDSWSEKFWLTFYTEEDTETPTVGNAMNGADMVLSLYKAAGYGGLEDAKLVYRIPMIVATGEDYIPMLSTVKDGVPYFAINHLKYCWYEDPFDYDNETPTPDNALIIDVFSTPTSWSSDIEKFSTTMVPLDATLDNRFFLYNGNFSYSGDFSFDRYTTDGAPSFIITKANLVGMDSYSYDFDVYKGAPRDTEAEAEHMLNLGTGTQGGIFMSDVRGFDPQVMFIRNNGGSYSMVFTNILTGEVEHTIAVTGTGLSLTSETDRVAYGDGYLYVSAQSHGEGQPNGDTYTYMAYFNPDGTLHHTDKINLGQFVDYATVYTAAEAFNPYIFNLDSKREYMALVKRRDSADAVGNHEELIVVSEDPADAPLYTYVPGEENGALVTVYFANLGTDNPLLVIVTEKDGKYINTAIKLPMQLFAEGDGSVENPYVITTPGGLEQLNNYPDAHFVLGCDIDAAGSVLNTRPFTFTGTLDGRGHSISNLHIDGCALISNMEGNMDVASGARTACVSNINFIDPVFDATKGETGMLIGEMRRAEVRNVHVYGGTISSNADVAGLVGSAYINSRIENCSVDAVINGGADASVGGIVYRTRTGSSVIACAFSGSISGGSALGGIVGNMEHADDVIENCHVNASITGKNTIGGIAGTSSHGAIRYCHVEGTLTATEEPRWGGGPKLGGIIGHLDPQAVLENEDEAQMIYAAEGCFVNLSSMSFTGTVSQERYPGHNDSMHRIVGYSVANSEPEVTDYDSDWEPIYGDPHAPEAWIRNNYAVSTLEIAGEIADAHDSTEGQSIDLADTGMQFFSELGWRYGNDSENPWSYTGDQTHPALYFEGGVLVLDPAEVTVAPEEEFTINVTCKGGVLTEEDLEGLVFEMDDETVLEVLDMGPIGTDNIEGVYITFFAANEGSCKLTVGLKGKSAEGHVTVKADTGINDIVADNGAAISFDGTTVRAAGCIIDVYTTMGVHILSAAESADLSRLGQGMYIVRAVNAAGAASTLKVRVK